MCCLTYSKEEFNVITVRKSDLEAVQHDERHLADSIVMYLIRDVYQGLSEYRKSSIYLFDCFFYSKLTEKSTIDLNQLDRWTKKNHNENCILYKEYIFFPIILNNHWRLVCIVQPRSVFESAAGHQHNTKLLYLDSLNYLSDVEEIKNNIMR